MTRPERRRPPQHRGEAHLELESLGRRWLACFGTKDLDTLLSLYAGDARHYSPRLLTARPETGGWIAGHAALRAWWADAFARLPQLSYEERKITAGPSSLVLEYLRRAPGEPDLVVVESFEVRDGLITESRVHPR